MQARYGNYFDELIEIADGKYYAKIRIDSKLAGVATTIYYFNDNARLLCNVK